MKFTISALGLCLLLFNCTTSEVASERISSIKIETEPGGTGSTIDGGTFTAGESLELFAVLRNDEGKYIRDVEAAWSVTGPIGVVTPGPSITATVSLTGTGAGRVVATSEQALDGLTGTLVVNAAALSQVYVETRPHGIGDEMDDTDLTTDQTLALYSVGRDEFGNFVEDVAAYWQVDGSIGQLDDAGPSTSTLFQPTTTGSGQIVCSPPSSQGDRTGTIRVGPGVMVALSINDAPAGTGIPIDDVSLTADDTLQLYAVGHDSYGNYVAEVQAQWSLTENPGTGSFQHFSGSTNLFTPQLVGTTHIRVDLDTLSDTTGTINVTPGIVSQVVIEDTPGGVGQGADDRDLQAGTRLQLFAAGRDAAGNFVRQVWCTWGLTAPFGHVQTGPWQQTELVATLVESGMVSCAPVNAQLTTAYSGTFNVIPGDVARIRIVDRQTQAPVDGTPLLAGESLDLEAIGVDELGNIVGAVSANWRMDPDLGTMNPSPGSLNEVRFFTSGTTRVTAFLSSGPSGETGPVTISSATIDSVSIEDAASGDGASIGDGAVLLGATFWAFGVARDTYGNYVSMPGGAWQIDTLSGLPGTISPSGDTTAAHYSSAGATNGATFRLVLDSGRFVDSSGVLQVIDAVVDSVQIETAPGGNQTVFNGTSLTADDSVNLYLAAYEAGNAFIGNITGDWTVLDQPTIGTFHNVTGGRRFEAAKVGTGRIRAQAFGQQYTSGPVQVSAGALHRLSIEDGADGDGTELTSITRTADQKYRVHAVGRDQDDNFVLDVQGDWQVTNDLGQMVPDTGSTWSDFEADLVGNGQLTFVPETPGLPPASVNVHIDPGQLYRISIEAQADGTGPCFQEASFTLSANASTTLHAVGRDRDGNFVSEVVANWTLHGDIGSLNPTTSSSWTVFDATAVGQGWITADDNASAPLVQGSTGTISVIDGV